MRKARVLVLPALLTAGLLSLVACGGGSSTGGGGGTGTPPPQSSGLNVYPSGASVPAAGEAIFTGYVPSNSSATITWAVTGGSGNGTITTNGSGQGVYTAPATVPSPATIAITATSGAFSATINVTITTPQGITVSPSVAAVAAGSLTAFTATGASGAVTWEVNGTSGGDGVHGTIDSNGNYTAPATPPPGGSTVITAAAGGASGNATVSVVYSNASLDGTYAFSYTGDDGSGYLAVAGNFTAAGASATITGMEDLVDFSPNPTVSGQTISGTFSIGPDGRGAVTLSPTGETWQIALTSSPSGVATEHALVISVSSSSTTFETGSGTIDQQTTSITPLAAGHYVFQVAGLDVDGDPAGVAGSFTSLGNGAITTTGNVIDINDAGSAGSSTQNSTDDTTLTGSFIPGPGAPAAGTLTLTSTDIGEEFFATSTAGTLTFDFYIVSPNHIHLIETDGNAFMAGDVYAAPAPGNQGYTGSLLTAGNYSFILGGASTNGAFGAGGVLISGGASSTTATSGSITGGVFDDNAQAGQSQSDATLKSGSYTVDATTGRITLSSLGSNQTSGTFNLVAYVTAQDPANPGLTPPVLLLETDANVISSGVAYLQNGATSPSGSYALNLTGVATAGDTEQDILAALNITSTAITGTMDINNAEANNIQLGLNVSSSSTIVSVDSNGRGTATVKLANGAVFQLAYYVVDANTVVMLDTDSTRVATGTMLKQF